MLDKNVVLYSTAPCTALWNMGLYVYTVYYVYILYTVFILSLPVSISYWIGGSDAKITIFGMSYIHLKKNIFKHKNTYKNNNEGL